MIDRTVISLFGPVNSGKSTLANLLTGQSVSIVSDVAGTTSDPVRKAMEIPGVGPCMVVDTPGYDDPGLLASAREQSTARVLSTTDIAIFVAASNAMPDDAEARVADLRCVCAKTIVVTNIFSAEDPVLPDSIGVNARSGTNLEALLSALSSMIDRSQISIASHLVRPGDSVLLVMPQDKQAPAGRLILPQVQTIRELLDYQCTVVSVTPDSFKNALLQLVRPPKLIITDSTVFDFVWQNKPEESLLTSFSVLFARWKGDISLLIEGTKAFAKLHSGSRVLIAEACTHAPLTEDIGRVKLPAMIRRAIAPDIEFEVVSGRDWPDEIGRFDLIIHCGACMIGRTELLSRLERARLSGVPITNYGIAIAYFKKILDKIVY